MCQSNVYVAEGEREQLLMRDVSWLEHENGSLQLKNLEGNQRALPAQLLYADLVGHRLVLERTDTLESLVDRATAFHGHLGPYLVFGVRMGLLARERLGFEGHFDLNVVAFTGTETPVSCVIDGLQVSTGATLGKGNIAVEEMTGDGPTATFEADGRTVTVGLTEAARELTRGMADDESTVAAARRAMEMTDDELFDVREGG
ncbi:MAG: CooT family nickel-binding protein [Candidatus Brocadiia bacterium]